MTYTVSSGTLNLTQPNPVLCNQPEAFASDFGDDQSRYLLTVVLQSRLQHHQEAEWMLVDRTAAI